MDLRRTVECFRLCFLLIFVISGAVLMFSMIRVLVRVVAVIGDNV